jgi:hypothetical protein
MPAIAKSVREHQARFYWHLGDFRLGSDVDDDMRGQFGGNKAFEECQRNEECHKKALEEYRKKAWDDFITQQITPFDPVTVYLGIGNHELYMHGTTKEDRTQSHADFLRTFSTWLGGSKTAYYNWKMENVHFINLDNSMDSGFEATQLAWLEGVLKGDASDSDVRAVVVGMHRALPNSLACAHSMNGDPHSSAESNRKSLESGRKAYEYLWKFQNTTGKHVYVLASHSHFYMASIFNTPYWNHKNEKDKGILNGRKEETTLDGWIIGTAGAVRYRLPENLPAKTPAITYAYGYLLGSVSRDGKIEFEFQQVTEDSIPREIKEKYGKPFVDFCFLANRHDALHVPEESCSEQF